MRPEFLIRKDVVAGVLFILIGVVFGLIGLDYGLGRMRRFEPGFFPVLVSALLVLSGIFTVVKGIVQQTPTIDGWSLRAFVILGAVVLFAMLIRPFGLFVTVALVSLAASLAGQHRHGWAELVLAGFLAVMSWVIFSWMLNTPLRLWPEFLGL